MEKRIKLLGLGTAKGLGLFDLASSFFSKSFRILMYHRFDKIAGNGKISKRLFETQMAYLKSKYNVIELHQFERVLRGSEEGPRNAVAITIDDGYRDFYEVAYPALIKFSLPATVFLATEFINGHIWLWHDLIDYSLKHSASSYLDLEVSGKVFRFDLTHGDRGGTVKSQLYSICTSVGDQERNLIIQSIIDRLNIDLPRKPTHDYAPLTWEQICEMSENAISFGAHTCCHPILSKLNVNKASEEIYESKKCIENVIKKPVTAFCYPNGTRADFNEDTKRLLKGSHFSCAVTALYGINDESTDPYELRRIAVGNRPYIYFLQDLSGFGVLRARAHRFLKMS
ncbi:MAG: polysaccharide deacetylase family protein [Candidatus Hodarchaeota archaeon]